MLSYETNQKIAIYNIITDYESKSKDYFGDDDVVATQFGIEQVYFDECNKETTTVIQNISDQKELIELLLVRLRHEDVHPCILLDIIEDFIVEIAE